jgi:antitoxin component of RelBE/YafQ-DinJ toxin-antitoxin module
MRRPIHTAVIKFRASDALRASAEALARQQGMSMSELVRDAVRQAVRQAA